MKQTRPGKMLHSNPLKRIIVCGLGSIGRRHLKIIRELRKDIDISVLRSGTGEHLPEESLAKHIFYDIQDAAAWMPDAAVIASPAHKHLEQALQFARQSTPLLIEKPIGLDYRSHQWDDLIQLSKQAHINTAYVFRCDPLIKNAIQYIQQKRIGVVTSADFYCGSWLPDWRPEQDYSTTVSAIKSFGGGVLYELSHEIDIAQFIFGHLNLEHAYLANTSLLDIEMSVEDSASLSLTTEAGQSIHIRLDFCSRPPRRYFVIRGHKGELKVNLIERTLKLSINEKEPEIHRTSTKINDLYYIQMRNFLDSIENQSLPLCSVEEALKTLELVDQAKHFELRGLIHD